MMKLTKYGVLMGTLAATLLGVQHQSVAQTSTNATAVKGDAISDPIIAKGKGFEIKRSKLEDQYVAFKSSAAAQQNSISEQDRDYIQSKMLERLVITQILLNKATDDDKKKAKEEADKLLASLKERYPDEATFNAEIKDSGVTVEQFKARLLEQATCETVIRRELEPTVKVTDADVKKYYDDNPSFFEKPEQVHVAHILILTIDKDTQKPMSDDKKKEKKKLAEDIRARAEKGEDFGKLVKQYSEDPGSKDKGGEYTFGRGDGMAKEFEAASFSLKTNQISDIVETSYGYHIIKLLDKTPAGQIPLDDKTKTKLKEYLTNEGMKKQLPDFLERIKKESNTQILDEKLAKAMTNRPPMETAPEDSALPRGNNTPSTK